MDEEFEMELYENDLETWETNQVYEDMALERAEAEAEALASTEVEKLSAIIKAAVSYRDYGPDEVASWVIEEIALAVHHAGYVKP